MRTVRGSVAYLPAAADAAPKLSLKTSKRGPNECWLFKTRMDKTKYPSVLVGGRAYLAHRMAWVIHNQAEPAGMVVCHSCDTPHCVNPAHLWLGTDRDNTVDNYSKRAGTV